MASRKQRFYFQAHKIEVLTDQPLKIIMHNLKASERLIKLVLELRGSNIKYMPRTVIKAQALADFMVDCTIDNQEVVGHGDKHVQEEGHEEKKDNDVEMALKEYWVLYFEGAP